MMMPHENSSSVLCLLFGASNLARAYNGLVNYMERCLQPRPVRFFNALGPGRCYCVPGGLLNIVYPPIGVCGIVDAAGKAREQHLVALITDIGNDIMFDIPAGQIIGSLDKLFRQLKAHAADIVVTAIPNYLENEMSELQFRLLRTLLFPKSRVGKQDATAAVRDINRFLQSEAGSRITLITGLEEFYGFDKIHFSPFKMHTAWTRIAKTMLKEVKVETSLEVTLAEMLNSLGAQALRLTLGDMFRVYEKGPEYF